MFIVGGHIMTGLETFFITIFVIMIFISFIVGLFAVHKDPTVLNRKKSDQEILISQLEKLNSQFSSHVKSLESDKYNAISPYKKH